MSLNIEQLRMKYSRLTPRERSKLFWACALSEDGESILAAMTTSDNKTKFYAMQEDLRLILFSGVWMVKLALMFGRKMGAGESYMEFLCSVKGRPEKQQDLLDIASEQIYEKMRNQELKTMALAQALSEFDESEGGWLKGIAEAFNMAPVLECIREQIDGSTHFPEHEEYQKNLNDYRRMIKEDWAEFLELSPKEC
jgi:hypothetical protein